MEHCRELSDIVVLRVEPGIPQIGQPEGSRVVRARSDLLPLVVVVGRDDESPFAERRPDGLLVATVSAQALDVEPASFGSFTHGPRRPTGRGGAAFVAPLLDRSELGSE
jgi:hypothetical protein